MSRIAWAAIIAAIAFPTIALVVVLLHRPAPPPGPPGISPPPPSGWGAKGGPPPHKGPPLRDQMLVGLRKELELTDEQVDEIWKIGQPARRRMAELDISIAAKEGELRARLDADDAEEEAVLQTFEQLHELHFDREKLRLLTPLRLREVLNADQRSKLVELWRDRAPRGFGKGPGARRGPRNWAGPGKGPRPGYPGPRGGFGPPPGPHGPPGGFGPPPGPHGPPGGFGPPPGPHGPPEGLGTAHGQRPPHSTPLE